VPLPFDSDLLSLLLPFFDWVRSSSSPLRLDKALNDSMSPYEENEFENSYGSVTD
jgi:hypothetical protein